MQTEICAAVISTVDQRPAYVPRDPEEDAFLQYLESTPYDIRSDIAVRIDQALQYLRSNLPADVNVESGRVLINEAFHSEALAEMRGRLGAVLKGKHRVAVFIDNLDKGWQRGANLPILARLILGLLTARGRLATDFGKQDYWRDRIKLSIAIFLRSDIFVYVKKAAREPDKLSTSSIVWRDPETLFSVLQERLESTWIGSGGAPSLWGAVFPAVLDGSSTQEFLMRTILPRPRDLVYLCNDAISRAIDRRHDSVSADDLLAAVENYSQYAYEALLVENGVTIPDMEAVLFSFLGCDHILTATELLELISQADLPKDRHVSVQARLIQTSFLGIETASERFEYPEVGPELDRALARAARLQPDESLRRFRIHTAFHRFLDVQS